MTFVGCYIFFENSLDPDQDRTKLCPDLDTNCLYLLYHFRYIEKKSKETASNPKKDDLKVTESTLVCSKHFSPDNYIIFSSKKRALKYDAVPTFFPWTKTKRRKAPKRRYKTSETETASETEQFGDINDKNIQKELLIPCTHQLSIEVIKSSDQTVPLGEVW